MIARVRDLLQDRLSLGQNSLVAMAGFALRIFSAVLGFSLSFVIARLYGADGLGTYSVAVTTAVFCGYLALVGQEFVVVRSVAGELKVGEKGAARGVLQVAVMVAVPVTVLIGAIILLFSQVLTGRAAGQGSYELLFLAAPALLGVVLTRLFSWALRGANRMLISQALEGLTIPVVVLTMLLVTYATGNLPSVWGLGTTYVAATFIGATIAISTWWRISRGWPVAVRPAPSTMLKSGIPMLIAAVSTATSEWAALFSTNMFAGPAAAGQLRVAIQLMTPVFLLTASLESVIGPQVARAWKVGDREAVRRMFRKGTIGISLASTPILLGVIVFAEPLMGLFGAEFREGARALQILAVAQLVTIPGGPMGTVLVMSGHDKTLVWYSLASMVVIALLCVLVVPSFGATGGAMVVGGNMLFRRLAAQLTLRYVAKMDLSVWRLR